MRTPQAPEHKRYIVVGVDGSELSRAALRWAYNYALRNSVELRAVHAWMFPTAYSFAGQYLLPDIDMAEDARIILSQIVLEELGSERAGEIRLETPFGASGASIVERAADAELVVIGASGGNPLTRLLIGSTTAYVVQHAHCPVVVWRPRADVKRRDDAAVPAAAHN